MKLITLILSVITLSGTAQVLSKTTDHKRAAEYKAIQLIKPVEFSLEIYNSIQLKSGEAKNNYQQALHLFIETRLTKKRTELYHKFLANEISVTEAQIFVEQTKKALLQKINSFGKSELKKLLSEFGSAEKDHDHEAHRSPGGPCVNPDFEMCDFTDWNMVSGTVPYPSPAPFSFTSPTPTTVFSTVTTSTPVMSVGSAYDQHYICTSGTDAIGGFPMVYPGGTCTAAIGDFTNYNYGASQISKTFMVTSGDAILTLNYAVCLEDAGHTAAEQPYFRMRVYDAFGNSITCAEYEAVAGDGQPGWVNTGFWQYKPWTTVFIPLAPYIGQNVTVEFTVGDCAQGGHAGYAYVDASCDAMAFNMTAAAVCAGNPITISAPDGASSYLWNTGATTQTITTSTAGTYTVTVTPVTGSGCAITLDTTIVAYPNPVAAFIDDAPVCAGMPVTFTDQSNPSGATINQWDWNFGDGGTSSIQNPTHIYAAAGTYTVTLTVTTSDGCTNTITGSVTINTAAATINPAGPFCGLEAPVILTATLPGGTWSATCGACINATTGSFDPSMAASGSNTITYTVAGACGASDTETILIQPLSIDNIVTTDINCFGNNNGTIAITSSGVTQFSIDNGTTFQATGNFTGLGPGTYDIVVQNAIGCTGTGSATIFEPTLLTILANTLNNESCFGLCDGDVAALPNGGTIPYTVSWTGSGTGSGLSLNDVCPGTYTATVVDDNGCTATASTPVTGPTQITFSDVTVPETCPGSCDGSITITANGGSGSYQYSINGGTSFQVSNVFTGVCTGTFNVVIQDNTGCSTSGTTNVSSPNALTVTASPDVTVCIGQSTTISASSIGGTGTVTFTWDNGLPTGTSHNVDPNGTTVYNVTGTDANGCIGSDFVIVTENPPLNVIALSDNTICPGSSAGISAVVTSPGGGAPYNFVWTNLSDGSTMVGQNQTVSPSTQTQYMVVVTDGCGTPSADDTLTISIYSLPTVTITDSIIGCSPVQANLTNTTGPVTAACLWDFGDGSFSTNCSDIHTYTVAGCYDVTMTVTTIDGCVVSETFNDFVCVNPSPIADFTYNPNPADVFDTDIQFTNLTLGGMTYDWDFAGMGASDQMHPSFIFPDEQEGTYNVCLSTINGYGCTDSVCHPVIIEGQFIIYVPNAFTPDGDGQNEIFLPILQGDEPDTYEFLIFNRWGEVIFSSTDKLIGWDGTHKNMKCKEDVYVWKIRVKNSIDNGKREFRGHVSLLR